MASSSLPGSTIDQSPLHPFGRVVQAPEGSSITDIPVGTLQQWTEESRVLVLRGFAPLGRKEFADYCRLWGELLEWGGEAVIDLVVEDNPRNYLFASGDVPFHWDGAFVEADPRFFMFQCLDATLDAGGETVFCDTTAVYQDADDELRKRWEGISITYQTEKLAHYGGQVTEKLISRHPTTGAPVLRFAEPLDPTVYKNPVFATVEGIAPEEADGFLAMMSELVHRPEYCYAHAWQPHDIVLADNFSLIHGRNAFTGPTSRHLQRVEVI
ncbi:TauD/TfdA dioxygenase family protein [Streptomyces sp. NPDC101112]|uniref:TauD/TfdA dioxygenase family protein n=1 Tax=Streptomyces sp. NPDC101112 TaxID=3366105 RepID=UPI0037FBC7ED